MMRHGIDTARRGMTAAVAAILACTAPPAMADWAYTRWGMSEAEVLAAGNGRITPYVNPNRETWGVYPTLVGSHSDLRHSYDVAFYFDAQSGGLDSVQLAPTGRYWCLELLDDLRSRYGWHNYVREDFFEWHDAVGNNKISYRLDPCWVRYEPLVPPVR